MSDLVGVGHSRDHELFTYEPLEQDGNQASIRLIKVEPELHESGLVQVQIKHSTVSADYVAISYMWGQQAERHRILINDHITTIGNNLHQHLYSLRTFESGQWYWVDALSIDQQNAVERCQQVKLMAEIFEGARNVLAFIPLNPGYRVPPESPFQTLNAQSGVYVQSDNNITDSISASPTGDGGAHSEQQSVHAFEGLKVAAAAICQSRYWHRTWIIQEIALARTLYLTDGQNKTSWDNFSKLIDILHEFHKQGALWFIVPHALIHLQDARKGTRRSTLAALVSDFSSSQCSDWHDKVYGLIAMLQNGHRFPVDYRTNELEFFLDALKFGQGPGADFDAEAQVFVLANTLFRSLDLGAGVIVNQAKAATDMPHIRCRASKLPLKQSSDEYGWLPYTCPTCSYKTWSFDSLGFNTIYCLGMDGSHQHLISEEFNNPEEHPEFLSDRVQMAVVIMMEELEPLWTSARIYELPDWDHHFPSEFWNARSLDGDHRVRSNARCHILEQKTHTPKLSSNGLFYEIDLPVPVFVSMSVRETDDVESLVGRHTMVGAAPRNS